MNEATPRVGAKRVLDGLCWAASGAIALFLTFSGFMEAPTAPAVLLGLAALGYGGYILLARGTYWTHTAVYLVPFLVIALSFK